MTWTHKLEGLRFLQNVALLVVLTVTYLTGESYSELFLRWYLWLMSLGVGPNKLILFERHKLRVNYCLEADIYLA